MVIFFLLGSTWRFTTTEGLLSQYIRRKPCTVRQARLPRALDDVANYHLLLHESTFQLGKSP